MEKYFKNISQNIFKNTTHISNITKYYLKASVGDFVNLQKPSNPPDPPEYDNVFSFALRCTVFEIIQTIHINKQTNKQIYIYIFYIKRPSFI